MWFDSGADILRIVLIGTAAYVTLVIVLRISGKRTLGQLHAFDFVVTVALGSILATILLNSDVSWAEGAAAFALVAALQFAVAWVSTRWRGARATVTSPPALLLVDGKLRPEALRAHRLTASEVRQAIRSSGNGDLATIGAVVLETNGTFDTIPWSAMGSGTALDDIQPAGGN